VDDKDFVLKKLSRNSQVVNELKNSGAWKIISEDFLLEKQRIDDTWHLVSNEKDLQELRVAKMAVQQILALVGSYEHDLKIAQEQIATIDDPEAASKINYGDR
jgi:hypothetical protein